MNSKKLISRVLVVFFIALFAYYFSQHTDDFRELLDLNPVFLGLVVIMYVGLIFTNGLFIKTVLVPYKKKISYLESFRVSLLSSIGNYFGPLLGGLGMRAIYLKKKIGLSYTDFLATLYGFYVISFMISAIVGLISLLLLSDRSGERGFYGLALFFIGVVCGLLLAAYYQRLPMISAIVKKLSTGRFLFLDKLSDSWKHLLSHHRLVVSLIRISCVNLALLAAMNYFEFRLIGVSLDLGALLLYTCLGSFSILISLTPGALGIREAVFILSSGVIGISNTQILAVALIDRTMQFIVMGAGWGISSLAHKWFKQDVT